MTTNSVLSSMLDIDRTQPFNPSKVLKEGLRAGLTIWRGATHLDGLSGEEEQDKRSLSLLSIDPSKVQLKSMLRRGEEGIFGNEWLKRLKSGGYICLDAKILQTFSENKPFIPENWKRRLINGNAMRIFFDGTVLCNPRNPSCIRCTPYFFWWGSVWTLSFTSLSCHVRSVHDFSAVLA